MRNDQLAATRFLGCFSSVRLTLLGCVHLPGDQNAYKIICFFEKKACAASGMGWLFLSEPAVI
jgi:hypothetical protein